MNLLSFFLIALLRLNFPTGVLKELTRFPLAFMNVLPYMSVYERSHLNECSFTETNLKSDQTVKKIRYPTILVEHSRKLVKEKNTFVNFLTLFYLSKKASI